MVFENLHDGCQKAIECIGGHALSIVQTLNRVKRSKEEGADVDQKDFFHGSLKYTSEPEAST
jgi:hypothetical protein